MSRPRKRRTADPAAVLAELRRVAEETVSEEDVDYFRPFGWSEAWAHDCAVEQQHRRLVQGWEAEHRAPLLPEEAPAPVLIKGVDYVATRADLEPSHG